MKHIFKEVLLGFVLALILGVISGLLKHFTAIDGPYFSVDWTFGAIWGFLFGVIKVRKDERSN